MATFAVFWLLLWHQHFDGRVTATEAGSYASREQCQDAARFVDNYLARVHSADWASCEQRP